VICSDWLYIDGKVEGAISLPGGRVTVGRYALAAANISAREVVIQATYAATSMPATVWTSAVKVP
jgi:hypothetical protein